MPEKAQKEGQRVPGIERERQREPSSARQVPESAHGIGREHKKATESQGSRIKIPQEWTLKFDRPQVSTLKTPGGGNYKRRK